MLTLIQLSKQYHSKSGHIIHALDSINLSFPDTGMIFILGSSGSGKSTLLNIIGGLDAASSGEMKVYDQSLAMATEKQLSQYRNRYIGFIFQDFNLINDITIYDNLALTCFAYTIEEERQQISDALNQVRLQGYESRYPGEISGGEFQRIAIARALLKDCKILLADEPTGNLNSELSKQIFDILKSISATRLVIVVTHNEELAKQYGERIIRLKDGKVIEDSATAKIEEPTATYDNSIKNKLSNKIAFKIANKTIVKKKVRMFFNFFALVLGFSLVMLSYVFVFYDRPYVDYRNMMALNDTHFDLANSEHPGPRFRQVFLDKLLEKYEFDYIKNYQIDSIQKLIDMGYQLKPGYKELTYDGIVINSTKVENIWESQQIFLDNQGQDVYTASTLDYEQIIGKYVRYDGTNYSQICGILETPASIPYDNTYASAHSQFYFNVINSTFSLPNSQLDLYAIQHLNVTSYVDDSSGFSTSVNGVNMYDSFRIDKKYNYSLSNSVVINQYGIIEPGSVDGVLGVNQDHGVYISLNLYNQIYNETWDITHYAGPSMYDEESQSRKRTLRSIPTHIGETISFNVTDKLFPDYQHTIENYQILGVIIPQYYEIYDDKEIIIPEEDFDSFNRIISNVRVIINVESISKKDLLSMLRYLYRYKLTPEYSGTGRIDKFYTSVEDVSFLILMIGVLAFLSILLSNVLFINQSLKSRDREIAILKSIGIRKADINKIFFIQVGMISCISWSLSALISFVVIRIASYLTIHDYNAVMNVVRYHPLFTLYLFLFIFVINFISTVLSILSSTNKNVIYSLRND